jgi:hypothetical protein
VLLGGGRVLDDVLVGIDRPRDPAMMTGDRRYQQLYKRLRQQAH